jgi:4-amino-4-deoxy-L-arabinose transferase-like glycosyltransferase
MVGTALRFYRLGANSLWIDELATLDLASHSLSDILRLSSSANFVPPLYFLLVHGALQVFGESEVTLRLLSAAAGIATIPVVWLLTRDMTGNRLTADLAATLLALNPLHLWYSQEARPYSLLLFFSCCALLALERAAQTNSARYWILFTLSSALAFLTHTTAVLLAAIAWGWMLSAPGKRHLIRPLLASSVAAVLLCTPSILAIAGAFAETQGTFHTAPRAITGLELPYTLFTYVGGYSFGPSPREIQDLGALGALRNNLFQSAIAGVGLLALLLLLWLNRRAAVPLFVALFAISLAGIFVLAALSGKPYNVRYTLPGLIGFLLSVSLASRTLTPQLRAFALAVPVGIAAIADAQWFWVSRYWKEDTRAAVTWLRNRVGPGVQVAVAPGYSIPILQYYARKAGADLSFVSALGPEHQAKGVPGALVLTRLHHVPEWRELRADFVGQPQAGLVQGQVPGYDMLLRPTAIRPDR